MHLLDGPLLHEAFPDFLRHSLSPASMFLNIFFLVLLCL